MSKQGREFDVTSNEIRVKPYQRLIYNNGHDNNGYDRYSDLVVKTISLCFLEVSPALVSL